jgi:hypothetical protein
MTSQTEAKAASQKTASMAVRAYRSPFGQAAVALGVALIEITAMVYIVHLGCRMGARGAKSTADTLMPLPPQPFND